MVNLPQKAGRQTSVFSLLAYALQVLVLFGLRYYSQDGNGYGYWLQSFVSHWVLFLGKRSGIYSLLLLDEPIRTPVEKRIVAIIMIPPVILSPQCCIRLTTKRAENRPPNPISIFIAHLQRGNHDYYKLPPMCVNSGQKWLTVW